MTTTGGIEGVAVIGMAGRFPKARNVDEFWANLRDGRECFAEFSVDDIVAAGVPRAVAEDPAYVRRAPVLENPAGFDARLFNYSPREAELIDPQHRILLECAHEALEHAAHDPLRFAGLIGIWAGCGINNYWIKHLMSRPGHFEAVADFQTIIANDKDYLASRIAYRLGLRGPAVVVQSACSTSLVAVHLACQALLTYQCDLALAGGVSLQAPRAPGYLYREGEIFSPDGFCRPFDKQANGTVLGEGAGLVVLRRLEDAVAGGDRILGVIRGSAVNNDGSARAGYTAPGAAGQAELVTMAHIVGGLEPRQISYVEAHGTGTPLGDPIEVAALTQAFRRSTDETGFCGLGSVKANVGHLDVAAGIAGLIKVLCALRHRQLPATLHFREPNPELKLERTPFRVVDRLSEWLPRDGRRIAGVSSFGLGGTNAHVVVEEYFEPSTPAPEQRTRELLVVSAATESALSAACARLASHLTSATSPVVLSSVARTLALGRRQLKHRRCVVADSIPGTAKPLTEADDLMGASGQVARSERQVVFLFSGQGSQYPGMGADLYRANPVFRDAFADCSRLLGPFAGGKSLTDLVFDERDGARLSETEVAQPALFAVEYALAQTWRSMGIEPAAMVGHSIGEYVAACIAGVFSLADAVHLVRERGRLMQSMPRGTMLSIQAPVDDVKALLPEFLDLCVINGPQLCVVGGAEGEIEGFIRVLESRGLAGRRLQTSHAFHSRMMEEAAVALERLVARVGRKAPQIPITSNHTGEWMTQDEAADPARWGAHLRHPVLFQQNLVATVARFDAPLFLEVGPGASLCAISRQQASPVDAVPALASMRQARQQVADDAFFLRTFGALWCHGVPVDWRKAHPDGAHARCTLPTYPFEHERLWVEVAPRPLLAGSPTSVATDSLQTADPMPPANPAANAPRKQLVNLPALLKVWEHVLGTPDVGPQDNFFDLGGQSILAMNLLAQVEKLFGVRLPLAALLDAPTPAECFALINATRTHTPASNIVTIVRAGKRPPVFLFHSHGGNVLEYYRLARLIGRDRPVHALQCPGVDGTDFEPRTIEEFASEHLEEVRAIQPAGPYLLGGYCFGGLLAVEVALQLRLLGQDTALVFMINAVTSAYPTKPNPALGRLGRFRSRLWERLALERTNLVNLPSGERWRRIQGRIERFRDLAGVRLAKLLRRAPGLVAHLEFIAEANDRAWSQYQPRPYDGPVLFFGAQRQPPEIFPDPMLGWSEYLRGPLEKHCIPGFRQTLLDEPAVSMVAERIRDRLERV